MMAWGYTLGPGQAAAIGIGLEEFGFMHGASVGLIFGALGFVYACFVGILLIHWGIRKRKTTFVKTPEDIMGLSGILKKKPIAGRLTTSSEAIDTFTLQLALCGLVYIVVYAIIRAMTGEETGIVWGFAFIITAITGLIARSIFDRLHITDIIDAGLQTRIMNTCVDYLITAAIAAIPLIIIREYVIPIGLISISGMIITLFATIWLAPRIWKDHIFERLILCYGTLTGTISTGLALLRVVDPHFKSPAAMDYALGMWFCMFFMLPLMIIVNIPVYYGSEYTYYTLIGLTIFSIVLLLLWRVFGIWKK
jgi:ESS family glutamate:Na+ symporter